MLENAPWMYYLGFWWHVFCSSKPWFQSSGASGLLIDSNVKWCHIIWLINISTFVQGTIASQCCCNIYHGLLCNVFWINCMLITYGLQLSIPLAIFSLRSVKLSLRIAHPQTKYSSQLLDIDIVILKSMHESCANGLGFLFLIFFLFFLRQKAKPGKRQLSYYPVNSGMQNCLRFIRLPGIKQIGDENNF